MSRRDQIYAYICAYAKELHGPTPNIREISQHFGFSYSSAYDHVIRLVSDGLLRQDRGKLVVIGSSWREPPEVAALRAKSPDS